MDRRPDQRTVEEVMERVSDLAATIEQRPKDTISPSTPEGLEERLLRLVGTFDEGLSSKLELRGTLGEGGMGRVRLATQRSLSRDVAVKTLREDRRTERSIEKLLREAWVTGSLEHPNVVPVYDLALDPEGLPLIVLKKIEGTGWDQLMHEPEELARRFGATDPLEWNLRILLQVCNAVHFAHSRGILHRDLKPENVMIGEFGEVYLVDWGIAVALRDDGTGRLPLAADAKEVAGTPAYMAPEMLGGRDSRLSERTDVYLLGSVLYEIVTGRAPHQGEQLMQFVTQIIESNPPIGPEVPRPLRRMIRRAMDPDPEGRFENAEQLRLALEGYLQHRDAIALAAKADAQRATLEELLEEAEPSREAVYHAFAECRFGYRHALEVWPDHAPARQGLARAIEEMVGFELSGGEPEGAHSLLMELDEPDPDLVERVRAARAAKRAEDASLRRLKDDLDPQAGRRTRAATAFILGLTWSVIPFAGYAIMQFRELPPLTHWHGIAADGTFLVLMSALFIWARDSMTRTSINRRLVLAAFSAVSLQLLLHVVELTAGGTDVLATFRHAFLVWAAILAISAPSVELRLWIPACAYALGFVVLAYFPEQVSLVMGCCNLTLFITMISLWGRLADLTLVGERMRERRARRIRWVRRHLGLKD